ncbi:hypothetical protein C8R44DRAFT_890662 [Mycena epipterygia]|nr:hypothetical protein C8R44DRAFT_890662 [Mycena epipterygia]
MSHQIAHIAASKICDTADDDSYADMPPLEVPTPARPADDDDEDDDDDEIPGLQSVPDSDSEDLPGPISTFTSASTFSTRVGASAANRDTGEYYLALPFLSMDGNFRLNHTYRGAFMTYDIACALRRSSYHAAAADDQCMYPQMLACRTKEEELRKASDLSRSHSLGRMDGEGVERMWAACNPALMGKPAHV